MQFNIFHRIGSESHLSIVSRQQELVHGLGMNATLFLSYRNLFEPEVLAFALEQSAKYGDEIGLGLHDLGGPGMEDIEGNNPAFWLFDFATKKIVLERIRHRWEELMPGLPTSAACYHLDSSSLDALEEFWPTVKTAVGGCFEEGVRVFHGCNHSWHLFNEGMPWNPYVPSRNHSLRPAANTGEARDIVLVPHLMRDMSLAYEGRNDFWASHPPNVARGMGNEATFCPYDLNLVDQFRWQEKFNHGYAYYNTFVGASWLKWGPNSEHPPEVNWRLYEQMLTYLAELKSEGKVKAMTLSAYGEWHRQHRKPSSPQRYWAKEMLYGSGKHYFWYQDTAMRCLIDTTQGGSIGDLRPYCSQYPVRLGADTPHLQFGTYPYLIQSQHRVGFPNHHEDGTRTTFLLVCGEETLDFATKRTKIQRLALGDDEDQVILEAIPFAFANGCQGVVRSRIVFPHRSGRIVFRREIELESEGANPLFAHEYCKLAPGITEYPQRMDTVAMVLEAERKPYKYSGLAQSMDTTEVGAEFPDFNLSVALATTHSACRGSVRDGNLFSPFVTLQLELPIQSSTTIESWLTLSKIPE